VQRRFDARALSAAKSAGVTALQSAETRQYRAELGLQYGRVVYDQYQLAELCPGNDDELSDPDGGSFVSQLRFGGGRDFPGHRLYPGDRAAGERYAGKFLGRSDEGVALGPFALLPGRRAASGLAGRCAKPAAL